MKSIGFTGTRNGMTDAQRRGCYAILKALEPREVHSGDCVGADHDFVTLVTNLFPNVERIGHPPTDPKLRAFDSYEKSWGVKPYLARNKDIVDNSELLIIVPKEQGIQTQRSGTWATARYAWDKKKMTIIVWPRGELCFGSQVGSYETLLVNNVLKTQKS